MALVEVNIIPLGTGTPSVSKYVARALEVLKGEKNIKYDITAMVKRAIGKVALDWQSALFFPLSWHKYIHALDRPLSLAKNPFGAFLGVKLDVESS